jgi:hypothetical protein
VPDGPTDDSHGEGSSKVVQDDPRAERGGEGEERGERKGRE